MAVHDDGVSAEVRDGLEDRGCRWATRRECLDGKVDEVRTLPHLGEIRFGFQGISAGWADVYDRSLDCQWIDITGVPSGRYVLQVEINPAHVIQENNYNNNTGQAEVTIP